MSMQERGKKGQITIFIIVALVLVAAVILFFMFTPEIKGVLGITPDKPNEFISNCIAEELNENLELITSQGGVLEPEHYLLYEGDKLEYLCYSEEYYRPCVVQKPMLKNSVEREIARSVEDISNQCFDDLKNNYERQGYNINVKKGDIEVELLPKRIVLNFRSPISLSKGESLTFDSTKVVLDNNLYELISIAHSIVRWETNYGDVEITNYMDYYHDLKVSKKKQNDGSTAYILTDRNTRDKFQFASRSVALPPGYGLEGVTYG